MKNIVITTLIAGSLLQPVLAASKPEPTHVAEIQAWRADRVTRLKAPDGWLTLIDLHWLESPKTSFGTARSNDIVLPAGPEVAGEFELQDANVFLVPKSGVTVDGKPAQRMRLASDASGAHPTIVKVGEVTLQLIERSGRLAIRVKDPNSVARKNFKGLDYFPIDDAMKLNAIFVPYAPHKKLKIANVIGMMEEMESPGALQFRIAGRTYRLDPVIEEGSEELFVIFGDRTNGKTTYGAGRYFYVKQPVNGRTVIDFNKAYNPPCSFTGCATCPLPPRQNKLQLAVEAGEKTYAGHH